MKILVQGDISRTKGYKKFECGNCGCVFVADNTEYVNYSNQRDGVMFKHECPCCEKTVWNYSNDFVSSDGNTKSTSTYKYDSFKRQVNG